MYLIVGVDPGTTKGIAALDFRGNVVGLYSSKEMGLDAVLKYLIGLGTVSIIATDVSPAPDFVLKAASQLGALVFEPGESVKVAEKMEATKGYKTCDAHQRDALSAALNAYGFYKNKFIKIDSLGLKRSESDEVKHLFIFGKSISDAQKEVLGLDAPAEEEKAGEIVPVKPQSEEEKRIRMLEKQNHVLRRQLNAKDDEIVKLNESISRLKTEYSAGLKKDSELVKKDLSIKDLKNALFDLRTKEQRLNELRIAWEKMLGETIYPVGIYPKKKRGYILVRQKLSDKDVDELKGVSFVFTDLEENKRILRGRRVKVSDTKYVKEIEGCFFISAQDVEKIDKMNKESAAPPVSIDNLVDNYRKDRRPKI